MRRKLPVGSERTATCPTCTQVFTHVVGRGRHRIHCSIRCRVKVQKARAAARYHRLDPCTTPGCTGQATYRSLGLCNNCYHQRRRTGSVARRGAVLRKITTEGYVRLLHPTHPMATKSGNASEHRVVMFDAIGEGPHPCFWCGVSLPWRAISVDHVNEVRTDNSPDNLVVSCNDCNRARGAILPFLARVSDIAFARFIEAATAYRRAPVVQRNARKQARR